MNYIRVLELEKRGALPEVFFDFQFYKKMFLSPKEAREYLGLSRSTFEKLIYKGDILATKMGNKSYKKSH